MKKTILSVLLIIGTSFCYAQGIGSNQPPEVECQFSNDDSLCLEDKNNTMQRMMILATLIERLGKDKAEACKRMAHDVAYTTKKPVEGFTYYRCLTMLDDMAGNK